jgi:hypothetical protein
MSSWQLYVRYRRQRATADAFAASRLQQLVFLAWAQEAGQARSKATAAVNMAARVQARMHNQLLFECFPAWRERAQRSSAIKVRLCQLLSRQLHCDVAVAARSDTAEAHVSMIGACACWEYSDACRQLS